MDTIVIRSRMTFGEIQIGQEFLVRIPNGNFPEELVIMKKISEELAKPVKGYFGMVFVLSPDKPVQFILI